MPTTPTVTALLPYSVWLDFRWALLLKLLSVYSAETQDAAIFASHKLAEAERLIEVRWQGEDPAKRLAALPFDQWNDFRWEIALNIISVISKANLEEGRAAVEILAQAANQVTLEVK